jgi:hypothetical protein
VQERDTVTEAELWSVKLLATTKPPLFRTLTMVQVPTDSAAEQVAVELYPSGTGDSVAVHVGSPTKPLTVNVAGVASDACALPGDAVPLSHDSDTVTGFGLSSEKFFATVNVPVFSVFVIVPTLIARPAHPAWIAV